MKSVKHVKLESTAAQRKMLIANDISCTSANSQAANITVFLDYLQKLCMITVFSNM